MKPEKDRTPFVWIFGVGILVIIVILGWGLIRVVQQTTSKAENAIQPISDLTRGLSTQVAQVLHPTPTVLPDPVTVIQQVRTLARLETIQYSVEKVITAETGQGMFELLFGDRLLFVAHGIVIAGVDLAKMDLEDLAVKDGVLYVYLPEAEIFVATLDNDKSYIYDRETGIFTAGDVNLETTARQAAEEEIVKAALEDGILKLARQNAENYLFRLFRALGYPDVIFIYPTPQP